MHYLASNNCTLNQLEKHKQKFSNADSQMIAYVRKYAKYLNQRISAYKSLNLDVNKICKLNTKVHKEEESFHQHDLASEQIIRKIHVIEAQLDFVYNDFTEKELTSLLRKEIFATQLNVSRLMLRTLYSLLQHDLATYGYLYMETMDELLGHFELMSKKHCKETIELYKRMPGKIERLLAHVDAMNSQVMLRHFGSSVTSLGLPIVPSIDLLEKLETHLNNLESKPKRK